MIATMTGPAKSGRRAPLRTVSGVAMLVALVATVAAAWSILIVVHDQEARMLKERTGELSLVFTSQISAIPASLSAQGGILRATGESRSAYEGAAASAVAAGPGQLTFAWLRPARSGSGYVVLAAAGDGLTVGDVITDSRARTFDRAMHTEQMVATRVIGPQRLLGFALAGPAAPAGSVLYRESALGPLQPPRQVDTEAFSELEVALYATPTVQSAQVLTSTSADLPLRGDVRTQPLTAGASHWLLSVKARASLVGSIATTAPLVTLVGGLVGSLLIGAVIESAARRRDAALALYASEHQTAETLQRSLLPHLPKLAGLDLAARYLASGNGQEVGGDWFDVFPVSGGRVGIAVGDVIGHDLAAASAMGQIRAALRAYALHGDSPASVITELGHLVDTFSLTQLVTVIYGVLEPPTPDGRRLLRYTNAGHLPPLLRHPDGRVESLTGGRSVVIGAPIAIAHSQAEQWIEPGSTLVMFTDGLVETPGRSLDEALEQLSAVVGQPGGPDADAMCERMLSTMPTGPLRDDIALLALRLTPSPVDVAIVAQPASAGGLLEVADD
jgi:serine phosphatase RsbU (regulator of sigma subunit)